MITLFYNEKNEVDLTYFTEVPEDLKNRQYMQVDEEPVAEEKEGKTPKLMCDGQKVWFEYEDRPLTELEKMRAELDIINNALLELAKTVVK